ncbi:hypothetical protein AB0D33_16010 [Streptomyces sp. NPDC048404]|uniref:hypothetical protein n=1 Tax=unclassified Streptomyces TaxID=2593676 RepID=UPI00341BDFDE
MNSGITVDESCVGAFRELKEKREVNTVIYGLNDTLDTCVVECRHNLTHEELLLALPADQPRLVVYDLAFATADGTRRNRNVLIYWLPPTAVPQYEEAYDRARAALLEKLDGHQLCVRATEPADLDHQRLVSQADD